MRRIYGSVVPRRLRAMGIREQAYRTSLSPWQNGFVERLIDRSGVNVWTTSCLGRDAFASGPEILRRLLQLRQNASIPEFKDAPVISSGSANRCDQFTCAILGGLSPPLRPN